MTSDELRKHFTDTFGLKVWPPTYEVDAETYGYVCQAIFDYEINGVMEFFDWIKEDGVSIRLGENGGIMFKGVELILLRK